AVQILDRAGKTDASQRQVNLQQQRLKHLLSHASSELADARQLSRSKQISIMALVAGPVQTSALPNTPQIHQHDLLVRERRLATIKFKTSANSLDGLPDQYPDFPVHTCLLSLLHTKRSKYGPFNDLAPALGPLARYRAWRTRFAGHAGLEPAFRTKSPRTRPPRRTLRKHFQSR